MVVFDIETKIKNKKQIATHCGYIDLDWLTYSTSPSCVNTFIEDLLQMRISPINIYAHNFANFDSFFIVPVLFSKQIKISKMYVKNNSIIFLHCSIGEIQLVFRDSFLYASISLNEILKMFNWTKQFSSFLSEKKLFVYLCFDIIGLTYFLYNLMNWTTNCYGINIVKFISVAQFSYYNYRRNFMNHIVFFLGISLRRLFQPFFGGNKIYITQNFGKNLFFYDVNSMYSFAMLKRLPNKYYYIKKSYNINVFFGFVCVTLIKKPENKFFCDFTKAIIFSEEIKMLIKLGHVFKFHYFIKFSSDKLFKKYVDHFYHLKQFTKSDLLKYFSKICLNSLYGKFATQISKKNSLQLSVAINSYSRIEMSQYKNKEYFIYTDTDSIIYTKNLDQKYIGPEIGMMKLVAKIDSGYFIPNYYIYRSGKQVIIKAKGIIKRIMPKLTELNFDFKLLYFKKEKYSIYLKETLFKYRYVLNNSFYKKKNFYVGNDYIGYFY